MHFKSEEEVDQFIDKWAENERRHKLAAQQEKQEHGAVVKKKRKRVREPEPIPELEIPEYKPSTNVNWGELSDKLAEALKRKRSK